MALWNCILPLSFIVYFCNSQHQVPCPKRALIRRAENELSWAEGEYIKQRSHFISTHFFNYLEGFKGTNISLNKELLNDILRSPPTIALSISGGGYRSMLTATGFIQEMDSVGLFDCLTYISGLSGGSWVLLDLILHDFDPHKLLKFWDLGTGILEGIPTFDMDNDITGEISIESDFTDTFKRGFKDSAIKNNKHDNQVTLQAKRDLLPFINKFRNKFLPEKLLVKPKKDDMNNGKLLTKISDFYLNLHFKVMRKKAEGFPLCFTDYWGAALLQRITDKRRIQKMTSFYELFNKNKRFVSKEAPIPIFIANCRNRGLKNFIFEFTPFEFGSWERTGQLFVELKYLGSFIKDGISQKCYRYFDDIGFITATSSSIFNNVISFAWSRLSQSSNLLMATFNQFTNLFGVKISNGPPNLTNVTTERRSNRMETDYAIYYPNPFFKFTGYNITDSITEDNHLYLVDGGEDGENIPLRNLLVPARSVESIFIIDSSSDTQNYANGSKLVNVLETAKVDGIKYLVDRNNSYVEDKPLVVGCFMEPTDVDDILPPILIYYKNHEVTYRSNMSTFKATYSKYEIDGMVNNGKAIFSGGNCTKSPSFEYCLPCFLLKRRLDLLLKNDKYPHDYGVCQHCFNDFCIS